MDPDFAKKIVFTVFLISMIVTGLMGTSFASGAVDDNGVDSVYGEKRSEKDDVIFFNNNEKLHGTIENEDISIYTVYGLVKIPLRKIAGISFSHSKDTSDQLITNNFNRLTGIIADRVIRFQTGENAPVADIRKEKIKILTLKSNPAASTRQNPVLKTDLFLMSNNDLLTGTPENPNIVIHTESSDIPVNLNDTKTVDISDDGKITASAATKKGDVIKGGLKTDKMTLNLDCGAQVTDVYTGRIVKIFIDDGNQQVKAFFGVPMPTPTESSSYAASANELVINSIGMELKLIRPGTFMMGSDTGDENEQPVHKVTISNPFYLGTHEVTQEQWTQLMEKNPSEFKDALQPVENISYSDAQEFVRRLSRKEQVVYRLPTEAEWEYACRAGSQSVFYWGNQFNDQYAWCVGNSDDRAHEVGLKKPNAWGLYDMSGNVWEWCENLFYDYPGNEFTGNDPYNSERAVRGGSWEYFCDKCGSSVRRHNDPGFHYSDLGFRLVREK